MAPYTVAAASDSPALRPAMLQRVPLVPPGSVSETVQLASVFVLFALGTSVKSQPVRL